MRAFVCPTCKIVMAKARGPWDIWHCPCGFHWDVYAPEGQEPESRQVQAVRTWDWLTGTIEGLDTPG